MQAVMEKTRATEDVRHFIDTHPYASEYFIDADALHADEIGRASCRERV